MNKIFQYLFFPIRLFLRLFFKDYELNIADRYLFSFRRDFNFISIITFISFLGITIGIAALIVILSIFNGFRDFAQDQMINFDPHIKIIVNNPSNQKSIENFLDKNKDKMDYSPAIEGKIIIKYKGALQAAYLTGIDTNKVSKVSGLIQKSVAGRYSLAYEGLANLVIGGGLADKLNLSPFDTISLMSPDMIEYAAKQMDMNFESKARVSALFQSYSKEYDETSIFSSIEFAKELFFKNKNAKQNYNIRIHNFKEVDDIKSQLQRQFPSEEILTWYDLHADMFNIMKLERLMVFVVMSLIIAIAAFNLLASLTMTVIEKQRDIAILKAIGMPDASIRRIFIAEGLYIGLVSVFWGTILGLLFCWGQIEFNWFSLDTSKYLIKGIPISIEYWNILLIDVFALMLSLLSTLLPGKYAFSQKIVQFLKNS